MNKPKLVSVPLTFQVLPDGEYLAKTNDPENPDGKLFRGESKEKNRQKAIKYLLDFGGKKLKEIE